VDVVMDSVPIGSGTQNLRSLEILQKLEKIASASRMSMWRPPIR
jgi:hypothetical protein